MRTSVWRRAPRTPWSGPFYPTASGDCWDFLNQVRRDWQVHVTIPAGSFWADCGSVTSMSDADLRQFLEWSGCKWAMLTPWLDCYPAAHPTLTRGDRAGGQRGRRQAAPRRP